MERIYVNEKIYDQYIDEFIKEVKSWKIGSPVEEGIYIGPLSRKEQLTVLESQVADAMNKGAISLTGGKKINGKGYFFEPTVLVNVNHDMNVMKDESFGPVIGIMKVKDDEEAIQLMKDTEYGLTASVYSADQKQSGKYFTANKCRNGLLELLRQGECRITLERKKTFRIWCYTFACRFTCIYKTKSLSFAKLIICGSLSHYHCKFFLGSHPSMKVHTEASDN